MTVGSERTLETSEIMLEITLDRCGRERVSLGRSVGRVFGADVVTPVPVGAVGPSFESLTPEIVVGSATDVVGSVGFRVEVGAVGFRIGVTSDTTDDSTEVTPPTAEESSDDTPGRSPVSLVVSEVGIAPELVIVGVAVALVAPVPNAVVMPTTIPLDGEDGEMPVETLTLEGVASTLDEERMGKIPVGEASSPVKLDRMLDSKLLEGKAPVGTGASPVRLVKEAEGETPVGKGDSPVRLGEALVEGRSSVGRTPVAGIEL